MQKPIVHLGGTSKTILFEGYYAAANAIAAAIDALMTAAPNERDYPLGPDTYRVARREHEARCEALRAAQLDMIELYNHVDQ